MENLVSLAWKVAAAVPAEQKSQLHAKVRAGRVQIENLNGAFNSICNYRRGTRMIASDMRDL